MYFRFPCAPLVRSNPLHGSRISTIASLRSPKTRNLHSITATAQLLPTPIYYISADVPARMLHRMTGISSTRLHPPPRKGFLQSRRSIPTKVLTVFPKLPTVFSKVLSVFPKVLTVHTHSPTGCTHKQQACRQTGIASLSPPATFAASPIRRCAAPCQQRAAHRIKSNPIISSVVR